MTSIWNPGTGTNIPVVDSDNSYKTQRYIATEGQLEFTLTEFAYALGTNSLDVIINGVTQIPIKDFTEVTGSVFRLVEPAELNDDIFVRGLIGSEGAQSAAISAAQAAESALDAIAAAASVLGINNTFISTSITSNTISIGAKTFVVAPGKQFQIGQWVMVSYAPDVSKYIVGRVTGYNIATGVLDLSITKFEGFGTYADWYVSVTGIPQPVPVVIVPDIFEDSNLLEQATAISLWF